MNYGLKEVMPSPPERQHHKTVAELSRPAAGRRLSANISEGVHLGAALMWARLE